MPRSLRTRWLITLLAVVIAIPLLAAAGALTISRLYWGYWIDRPDLDPRVQSAAAIHSVTPVYVNPQPDGSLELAPHTNEIGPGWPGPEYPGPGWYNAELAAYPHQFDYYLLDRRALHALEQRGVAVGPLTSLTAAQLAGLMPLAHATGDIYPESPGYKQWRPSKFGPGRWFNDGLAYELLGADGSPLVLLALRGAEVSNDHRTYYEFLFSNPPGGPRTHLSTRRFYYDVAGMEGMEARGIFVALLILLSIAAVLLAALIFSAKAVRHAQRLTLARRGLCPHCTYDLTGNPTTTCPECGRAQSEPRP